MFIGDIRKSFLGSSDARIYQIAADNLRRLRRPDMFSKIVTRIARFARDKEIHQCSAI